MSAAKDQSPRLGRYIIKAYGEESVRAFVPPPLPPNPPVRLDALQRLLEQANQSLGRLDGLASLLPNLSLFIYAYVRKEAVLSSQIEGTQSSLSDLLLFENNEVPGVPLNDVQEVSNYVAALNHGLERLRRGFPLSLRLIREIHEVLLSKGRGSDKQPGEFRVSQNWIGGTRPGTAAVSYTHLLNKGGIVNQILGGWTLTGNQQYESGNPLSISSGLDASSYLFNGSVRANVISGQPLTVPMTGHLDVATGVGGVQYLNPNAFALPPTSPGGVILSLSLIHI